MPKRSHFGLREKRDRERERERGKKSKPFSDDFMGFCQSELGKPRVKAALCNESYAWVLESQDLAKVHENQEKGGVLGNHANSSRVFILLGLIPV